MLIPAQLDQSLIFNIPVLLVQFKRTHVFLFFLLYPGHLPIHPDCTDTICLAWNFEELLAVIRSHTSVVCYMAGHAHNGGYCQDEDTGVHHLTVDGVIETPPDSNAFATVSVYGDRMELKGYGSITDRVFLFPSRQKDTYCN